MEGKRNPAMLRNLFLAVILVLVAVIVVVSAVTLGQGPRESSVELVSKTDDGKLLVNDLNQGQMTIPEYNIPKNGYSPEKFLERNGVITYEGGDSWVGINVNVKLGDIDWQKVAESGVEYAMIRVGYRGKTDGKITADNNFEANITGALEAGLKVGVYFYSTAITDGEAEDEATFVLEKIKGYNVTYPIAFYWEYDLDSDGSVSKDSRSVRCNGEQVTGFVDTFCKKVKNAGFIASYYCGKSMGYESLNLERLKDYDMWYAEFTAAPSFYYDFKMWQYTKSGQVPGIDSQAVPVNLCLKKYA